MSVSFGCGQEAFPLGGRGDRVSCLEAGRSLPKLDGCQGWLTQDTRFICAGMGGLGFPPVSVSIANAGWGRVLPLRNIVTGWQPWGCPVAAPFSSASGPCPNGSRI